MSRVLIEMFYSHFPLVNLWYKETYPRSVNHSYYERLQEKLNLELAYSVLGLYVQVPLKHKDIKEVCSNSAQGRALRASITNDFRILATMLTSNVFFFGNEPTLHDLQAFISLVQLRLLYKEISYPLGDNTEYYYTCFYFVTEVSPNEARGGRGRAGVRVTFEVRIYIPKYDQYENEEENQGAANQYLLPNTEAVNEHNNEIYTTEYNASNYFEETADENKENNDPDNENLEN